MKLSHRESWVGRGYSGVDRALLEYTGQQEGTGSWMFVVWPKNIF